MCTFVVFFNIDGGAVGRGGEVTVKIINVHTKRVCVVSSEWMCAALVSALVKSIIINNNSNSNNNNINNNNNNCNSYYTYN